MPGHRALPRQWRCPIRRPLPSPHSPPPMNNNRQGLPPAPPKTSGGKGKSYDDEDGKNRRRPTSRSMKAGLQFPVGRGRDSGCRRGLVPSLSVYLRDCCCFFLLRRMFCFFSLMLSVP